jgi:uncharacterized membrane protein YdbT with pleckstrin-like domain
MTDNYIKRALGEQEKIIMITRQHWLWLFSSILLELVVIIVLTIGVIAISTIVLNPIAWLGFVVLIIPLLSMLRDILSWRNKQYIVTNRRVIQTLGIFNKNITDSSLEKVNDVKMAQSFLGRLFNFGTIEILTASELGVNIFHNIDDPIRFKTAMLNAKEQMTDSDFGGIRKENRQDVPRMIAELDQLRQKGIITEQEFISKKADLLAKM